MCTTVIYFTHGCNLQQRRQHVNRIITFFPLVKKKRSFVDHVENNAENEQTGKEFFPPTKELIL